MGLLVFKTSVPVTSWRVGSIPMHFRHTISGAHVAPSTSKSPRSLPFSLAVQAVKTIDAAGIPWL